MRIDVIQRALHRQPFVPFKIRLVNGHEIEIKHPDAIAWEDDQSRYFVYVSPAGGHEVVNLDLVVAVVVPAGGPPAGSSTEGNGG